MTEGPYVDPNSGAAAQPGGFAHSPVVLQDDASTDVGADFSEAQAEGDAAGADVGPVPPAGNANRDLWVAWAQTKGAPEDELALLEEGGLSRDELRTKYGS